MRPWLTTALLAALALGGCRKPEEAAPTFFGDGGSGHRGRYVGIGLFSPDRMWEQLTGVDSPGPAGATLKDDQEVIVVVDTATGEIRQCGNLSGHCIRMNPWTKPREGAPSPAAVITKHRLDLEREDQAEDAAANKAAEEDARKRAAKRPAKAAPTVEIG